jgi:hypothetical protein
LAHPPRGGPLDPGSSKAWEESDIDVVAEAEEVGRGETGDRRSD